MSVFPRDTALRRPLVLAVALVALVCTPLTPAHAADSTRLDAWRTAADFRRGTLDGLTTAGDTLVVQKPVGTVTYDDPHGRKGTYEYARWTSEWKDLGFGARSLVPSWNLSAPSGSWARIQVRTRTASTTGSWDTVAEWSYGVASIRRTSPASAQTDDLAKVSTDTVVANGSTRFTGYQLRILLLRPPGSTAKPVLRSAYGAAATYLTRSRSTSTTTMTKDVELAVPRYSQMIHRGHHPEWGGGGEAWCSPTSVAMVLRHFGTGPKPADHTWAKGADPWVDHAARYTYDHAYEGTGNWPFNTAYAGLYGTEAFVTRLDDLRDVEAFVKAGLPVVVSVAFARGGLTGAPISSTPGHLMVVVGFTQDGKVVANDPAGATSSSVRKVYSRSQLEKAWLGGSGGIAYVIRPTGKALPKDTARW